jgi:signal transduction histidine kinase
VKLNSTIHASGKGIPYKDQDKVISKLTSFTTFGTAKEKGRALASCYVKSLLKTNKGRIWFTSKPNEASTFSFTIPLKQN